MGSPLHLHHGTQGNLRGGVRSFLGVREIRLHCFRHFIGGSVLILSSCSLEWIYYIHLLVDIWAVASFVVVIWNEAAMF